MNLFGKGKEAVELTLASLKENAVELYNEVFGLGKAEGKTEAEATIQGKIDEAVAAERARCAEIATYGGDVSGMIKSGKSDSECAKEALKAANAKIAENDKLAQFKGGAAAAVAVEGDKSGVVAEDPASRWEKDSTLQKRYAKCGGRDAFLSHMAEWNAKPDLQKEYVLGVDSFLANRRAQK